MVAEKLGIELPLDVDARIAGAGEVGAHKPSTLVDLERGRPMEIDALLGSVIEIGRLLELPMPTCELVYALVRQRARLAGCYADSSSGKESERMSTIDPAGLAGELMSAYADKTIIAIPPASRDPALDLPTAYQVEAELVRRRVESGRKTSGSRWDSPTVRYGGP